MTQNGKSISIEAECPGYLDGLSNVIEGGMGIAFANWDNRNGMMADFEDSDMCSTASSCDNTQVNISDFRIITSGYTEEMPEEESEDEDDGDNDGDDETDAPFVEFVAWSDDFEGDAEFFLRGLEGKELATNDKTITMGPKNRAFVLDYPYDDEAYWAYQDYFLGGTMTYDVNVSDIACDSAAGVFLVQVDDEECFWNSKPSGEVP